MKYSKYPSFTIQYANTSDIKSSSTSESDNSAEENEETSIAYDSDSADNDKSSSSSIGSKEDNWLNGCRYAFITDKLIPNSKSKIKEHTLSYNNLDKALHDAHLLSTLQKTTNKKVLKTKFNKKLKDIHLSPIIFVKLVIPAGNMDRQ